MIASGLVFHITKDSFEYKTKIKLKNMLIKSLSIF